MNILSVIDIIKLTQRPGNIAECGVWTGDVSEILAKIKPDHVNLHLFDTFEGLPEFSSNDKPWSYGDRLAQQGDFNCPIETVQERLKTYNNILYHKGHILETSKHVEQCLFNYVHIDLDLYGGTRFCLDFFYDRLVIGGLLSIHDYHTLGGVMSAVNEFCAERNIKYVDSIDTGVLIYK